MKCLRCYDQHLELYTISIGILYSGYFHLNEMQLHLHLEWVTGCQVKTLLEKVCECLKPARGKTTTQDPSHQFRLTLHRRLLKTRCTVPLLVFPIPSTETQTRLLQVIVVWETWFVCVVNPIVLAIEWQLLPIRNFIRNSCVNPNLTVAITSIWGIRISKFKQWSQDLGCVG